MYKILKQLQADTKEISVLLYIDLWVSGHITYLDKKIMCFETSKRDGVYYTQVIRLNSIIAIEYVSDVRLNSKDKYFLDKKGNLQRDFLDEDDDNSDETFFGNPDI